MEESKGPGATQLTLMILAGLFCLTFGSMICCCGGSYFGAPMLVELGLSYILEDDPMEVTAAPVVDMTVNGLGDKVASNAGQGGTVVLSGPEINGALQKELDKGAGAFSIDGDTARLEISMQLTGSDKWLNMRLDGRMIMVRGLFQDFYLNEVKVGALDISGIMGENMAMNANQQLMEQRAKEPDLAAWLDAIDRAEFKDGALHLTIGPGGIPK